MKFRITGIAMIAAAFGIALAPAAAAKDNNAPMSHQQMCDSIWQDFEDAVNRAKAADDAGDTAARDAALHDAKSNLDLGTAGGCDWAAAARVPTYPKYPIAGKRGIGIAPQELTVESR